MAYDPTSAAQNRALVSTLILTIDALDKALAAVEQAIEAGGGQGVVPGLTNQGAAPLEGVGVPADVVLAAVQSVAQANTALGTLYTDEGGDLRAFRNNFTVQAIRPKSCTC